MEDLASADKIYEQRLHLVAKEFQNAKEEISKKDKKIEELVKEKAMVEKENRVLSTEIGKPAM